MPINDPAPTKRNSRLAPLLAFAAVAIAGAAAYFIVQAQAAPNQQAAQAPAELAMLQQQPTLGGTGTRYDIVVDFECPYCNQFLSGDAYATILEQAKAGEAQLNVTAAAFLNEKSVIKGSVYNCVAEQAGPAAALSLVPDLKAPGGDTNYWIDHAYELGAQHTDPDELQACLAEGALQDRANNAFRATGVPGVPAVFINDTQTPWSSVRPN